MKRYLFPISLIILLSCFGIEDVSLGDTFVKYYGGDASFELKDMIFRSDGDRGVVMLGVRADIGDGGERRDGYVIKIDENGNLLKEGVTLSLNTEITQSYHFEASRITAIDGGGYLLIGSNTNQHQGVVAAWTQVDDKLEMVGDWKFVGDSINNYYGVDICSTSDGGVLVAGYTDANGDNDFFYYKIGGTSATWSRIQERANSDDQLVRVLPISGENFAIFGRTDAISETGELGINVERSIIDQEGIIINSLIYGTSVERGNGIDNNIADIPYDVIESPGGFAIAGEAISSTGSYPFMMNVDLTGAVTNVVNYETEFASNGISGRAFGVTQSLSNDFILVGELIDFIDTAGKVTKPKNNELMVMRTDQFGVRLGEINNFGVENGEDKAVRVLTDTEGNILVGATYDFGSELEKFALLKMNVQGELKP